MDRFNTDPALIRDWMKGKEPLFVIVFAYNSGMDPAYRHREAHCIAGPDLKAAQQAAESLLSHPWETVSAEFCKIYQACPEDFAPLIAEYNRQGFPEGPGADDLAAALLSREDVNGKSRFDALRPVKVVSLIPDRDSMPEDLFRKELLYRIHGIVEDIGAKTVPPDGNACKGLILDMLPFEFFDEGSQFTGFLIRHFANKGEDASTTLNDYPVTDSSVQVLQDYLREIDKVHKLVFTGNAERDCVGCVTVRTAIADPDAAVGRKARLDGKPRRFKVTLRFEVSYSNEVEAADEDEAVDLVKQQAQTAPSGDFDWHGITDYDTTEAE